MYGFISYDQYHKELVLNETYESYSELKQLTDDIYKKFSKNILKRSTLYYIKDGVEDINKFNIIKDFINAKVGLLYNPDFTKIAGGGYFPPSDYEENMNFFNKTSDESNELIREYPDGILVIGVLDKNYIIHELQHGYDYIRSKTKMSSSKNMDKYNEKVNQVAQGKLKMPEKQFFDMYFRAQPEISALFTQAIDSINFDKKNSINVCYWQFKRNFIGYNHLTPKIKKDLARKFTQYYHKIREEQTT